MNKIIYIILICVSLIGCKVSKNGKGGKNASQNELTHKEDVIFKKLLVDGTTEKVLGNFEDAEKIFLECLKLNENSGVVHFELSGIYRYLRNEVLALDHAKKAVTYEPENQWYKTNYAVLNFEAGLYDKAEKLYRELAKEYPKKSEYHFTLAESLLYQGKLKEALEVYDDIEETLGATEELVIHKHKLYLQIDDSESAIKEIKKLIEKNPKEVKYYGILAELYENIDEQELALDMYSKILELEPDNGTVRLALYEYYRYHGNKEKSKEQLYLAFKNKDVDIDSKMKIMLEYYTNSERNESIKTEAYKLADLLIEAHPTDAKSFSVYADFLYRDNRLEEALNKFKKANEFDSSKFPIWSQIIFLESDLKKFEEMEKDSKKAIEIFPSHPTFYFFNGIANIQINQPDKAIETLNVGKELVFDNKQLLSEFYQYLGDAYHKKEDHIKSDESYDKSLSINPLNPYVLNNYSYYLALRRKDLGRAENMSLHSNQLAPDVTSFMDTYGWILFLQGKYTDAEMWLKKALLSNDNPSGEILEHYGDLQFKMNKIELAIEYWIKAKEAGGASDLIDTKINDKKYVE